MKEKKELKEFEKAFNRQRRWQVFFAIVFGPALTIAARTYGLEFFERTRYIYYAAGVMSIIGFFAAPLLALNKEKE